MKKEVAYFLCIFLIVRCLSQNLNKLHIHFLNNLNTKNISKLISKFGSIIIKVFDRFSDV